MNLGPNLTHKCPFPWVDLGPNLTHECTFPWGDLGPNLTPVHLPMGGSGPQSNTWFFTAPRSPRANWHVEWFSRSSTAHGRDQQTDHTTLAATGRILRYAQRCGPITAAYIGSISHQLALTNVINICIPSASLQKIFKVT